MTSDDLTIRQAIRQAAARRQRAETSRTKAIDELTVLVRRAVTMGVPIATVARDAGVSRPSIYALLETR